MEIKIKKTKLKALRILRDLNEDVLLTFGVNGLGIRGSDRASVSVFDFFLTASEFEKYEVEGVKEIPINLKQFLKVLNRFKGEVKLTSGETNLTISGQNKKFIMPLSVIDKKDLEDVPNISKLEYSVKNIEMNTSDLIEVIRDSGLVKDCVIMETTNSNLLFYADNTLKYRKTIEVKSKEKAKSKYALEYLENVVKPIAEKISLSFGNDFPIKIEYDSDVFDLIIVIAPRVIED